MNSEDKNLLFVLSKKECFVEIQNYNLNTFTF